jgi:glycosyltransferase involved in cell wall biosynthesis
LASPEVLLSIVIVGQDNAPYIRPVLEQAARIGDEVVFVDGGSLDDTLEIARSVPGVRVFERRFDGDIATQKNHGFDQARGRWILSLDSDELLSPRLERLLPWMLRIPFVHWYRFPRYWLVARDGRLFYARSKLHYPDYQLRLFRNRPDLRYPDSTSRIHHHLDQQAIGFGFRLRFVHLFHYCFLILSEKDLRAKIERYEAIDPESHETNQIYVWDRKGVKLRPLQEALPGMLRVDHGDALEGSSVEPASARAACVADHG